MIRHLILVLTVLVALLSANSADAACTNDFDCKGDRVCNPAGECVAAETPKAPRLEIKFVSYTKYLVNKRLVRWKDLYPQLFEDSQTRESVEAINTLRAQRRAFTLKWVFWGAGAGVGATLWVPLVYGAPLLITVIWALSGAASTGAGFAMMAVQRKKRKQSINNYNMSLSLHPTRRGVKLAVRF